MSAVAVDASVWVASQDPDDPCCGSSRKFFSHTITSGVVIHVPAFAIVEISCALARKLRNSAEGERLAALMIHATFAVEQDVNAALLCKAMVSGSSKFLRGADALYVATAEIVGCDLVSWDSEHIQRAGALSPDEWVAANPLS